MALSTEQVNSIYKHILDNILLGLESGALEPYQSSEIAGYIVGRVEKLDTEQDASNLYQQIAEEWPFMEVLLDDSKAQNLEKVEDEVSQGAVALLRHGKVEDALKLVKTVTN